MGIDHRTDRAHRKQSLTGARFAIEVTAFKRSEMVSEEARPFPHWRYGKGPFCCSGQGDFRSPPLRIAEF
jgi:hypothetical protein